MNTERSTKALRIDFRTIIYLTPLRISETKSVVETKLSKHKNVKVERECANVCTFLFLKAGILCDC